MGPEPRSEFSAPARSLVLPGNDLSAEFYAGFARELGRRGLATTCLTLPGYAGEPPLATRGFAPLVDAILPRVPEVLVGHSMGGLLALLVAAKRPPKLRRLVLLEPAIFPTAAIARAASARYLKDVVLRGRESFRNWNGLQRRVADLTRYPPSMLALYGRVRATSDIDTARALFAELPSLYPLPYRDVRVPTLLVRGAETGFLSRVLLAPLRVRLPDARVAVVPRAAHWIMNEADAAAADVVARFCDA